MKLTIDMETRSKIDLKKCGMYCYAEDESTDILCVAFKEDNEEPYIWVPDKFSPLAEYVPQAVRKLLEDFIKEADTIEAHNAGFEMVMWHEIMHKRYGFPDLPFEKMRCSAAKAAAHALPRSLGQACEALGLSEQKDNTGYRIMLKMCKPRKPTKHDPSIWHEKPEDFKLLCEYCMQDVEAEYALSEALYDLSDEELEVWRIDQVINRRGVAVDISGLNNLLNKVKQKENELLLEVQEITGGAINSTRQNQATINWLKTEGLDLPDLQKATVKEALTKDIPVKAKRLLEIRQSLSKSSVSKLDAMTRMACKDNRVKGTTMYHGASTGRWSGRGIQPQNYPRDSYDTNIINDIVEMENGLIEILYDCPIQAASKCLRGMLTAAPGHRLFCADFSSIEARVLAWLACEEKVLDGFRKGLDPYKVDAMPVFNKPYEEINDKERQLGKTINLACGYQGYIGAFRAMASPEINKMSDEEIGQIIMKWRDARPNITSLWKGLESAALKTVKTGKVFCYGRIKLGIRDNFLHCRLPSGRLLSYFNPGTEIITTKWGQKKEVISFMGMNSMTNKWVKQYSYGGKLCENVVQGTARDILAEAMLRLEKAGYPVVLHVHDEIISEVKEGKGDLKDFENIMSEVPLWAEYCPLKAEGWVGFRYRKA